MGTDGELHENDEAREFEGKPTISEDSVRQFEKTENQLKSFSEEFGLLSKKNPNDAVNKFKLGLVNQVLEAANQLLGDDYRPFADFTTFSPDFIPTTSDICIILSQYSMSMRKFQDDHTHTDVALSLHWNVPGGERGDQFKVMRYKRSL